VSNLISRHLESQGLSQAKFAEELGVSQPTVSDWVRGEKIPYGENVRKLARKLRCKPHEVLADFYPVNS
jgi:transcriptional regulator with XRE-family HTH domain